MPLKLTVARYAVTGRNPPRLTETIILAETVHRALVELSNGSQVFTGCDSSHRPLQGHGHAHIFCESNPGNGLGGQGEITNITVYAPMGFRFPEQEALHRLKEIYDESELSVQLALRSLGRPEDSGGTSLEKDHARCWQERGLGLTHALPAHAPPQGHTGGCAQDEMRRACRSAALSMSCAAVGAGRFSRACGCGARGCTRLGGRDVPWHAFLRRREKGEGRPAANGAGYGFRIEFPEPVQGPVAVGYASHFGMGGFEGEPSKGKSHNLKGHKLCKNDGHPFQALAVAELEGGGLINGI